MGYGVRWGSQKSKACRSLLPGHFHEEAMRNMLRENERLRHHDGVFIMRAVAFPSTRVVKELAEIVLTAVALHV